MTLILRCFFIASLLVCYGTLTTASAKTDLDYLPSNIQYDPNIPKPKDILGTPVGEWHVRHDQLVSYMRILADKSERVTLLETGRTHENRPLLLLTITAEKNQQNIQQIQQSHINAVTSGDKPAEDTPLVIWMGYSVHGNEPSGSNASLLIAYYLAAGQGAEIDRLLNDNVVLLDPSVNPDGLSRFAQWANMHRGQTLVADPNHREHAEGWPSGRTNHYWFDLNRDWLLLTHPESRARIKQFHQWRPHVLTDFHEMGPNSTYFFQPGIPSRKNPHTPLRNVELTEALAEFHAKALDDTKQLYFTQEGFDDFYYGKGSTYPDAHGSIGILFEQASSRGHLQESINGTLSFPFTIQNQVTTSLSTFAGALANKQALLEFQPAFVEETKKLRKDEDLRGYVLSKGNDKTRFNRLMSILDQHKIGYQGLSKDTEIDDITYTAQNSIFVSLDQPQYRLIKSMFSERKRFDDNTFYDVSNWNLPLAFNIQYAPVKSRISLSKQAVQPSITELQEIQDNAYAYGFSWQDFNAPKLLQRLLDKKIHVRVSEKAFSATTSAGEISFGAGSVIVHNGNNQPDNVVSELNNASSDLGIQIWSIQTGMTLQGLDLGSSNMRPLKTPKVMIVGGKGTSQYEAGEVWHHLDTRVGIAASVVELDNLDRLSLSKYTHMIWVNGRYSNVDDKTITKIETWVKNGGVLIGQKSAAKWFSDNEWLKAKFMKESEIDGAFDQKNLNFADKEALEAKQRIAGAVFETQLDVTHPLGFGYQRKQLPVFRNSAQILLTPTKPFITVAKYTEKPLMAGYTSDELEDLVSDSAAIVAHNMGRGKVIAFTVNPNFRGYWYGTNRLLSNAIYMSMFIDAQG